MAKDISRKSLKSLVNEFENSGLQKPTERRQNNATIWRAYNNTLNQIQAWQPVVITGFSGNPTYNKARRLALNNALVFKVSNPSQSSNPANASSALTHIKSNRVGRISFNGFIAVCTLSESSQVYVNAQFVGCDYEDGAFRIVAKSQKDATSNKYVCALVSVVGTGGSEPTYDVNVKAFDAATWESIRELVTKTVNPLEFSQLYFQWAGSDALGWRIMPRLRVYNALSDLTVSGGTLIGNTVSILGFLPNE